jgi:outer membrane protein assembly factor BamB
VVDGAVYGIGTDGNVFALSADSGALRWKRDLDCESHSSVAVGMGAVFAGNLWGGIFALDAATGANLWIDRQPTQFSLGSGRKQRTPCPVSGIDEAEQRDRGWGGGSAAG